ncbi:hypothetical protein SAE02_77040 [Skermanella aerolata]|uniref:Uncharacterized protein n=1 Tax=Skermanella aerolata TaxID=393310 RepID=A0A512E490_9PROT|nr:hypothetical protein SAE02_77040 [Skermanella aerolata]
MSAYGPMALGHDPLLSSLLIAASVAAVSEVVKALTKRVLNRWVPEPRLARPEPEFIL